MLRGFISLVEWSVEGETQLVPVSKVDEEKREEQPASGGDAADEGEGMDTSDGQLVPVAAVDEDDAAENGKKENEKKESSEKSDKKGSSFAW